MHFFKFEGRILIKRGNGVAKRFSEVKAIETSKS